uniref:Uncharacterized protein n=1 Tax=Rhizophagus irregularis (strain DAOM 181602 / DAOM 197198 / MUCL 43194) TaxID=747089 RepID=U9UHT4_RHIID
MRILKYNDIQTNSSRTHPESITECQRFWVYLRKLNFLNLMKTKTDFKNIGEDSKLSDQLKNFSNLAKKANKNILLIY